MLKKDQEEPELSQPALQRCRLEEAKVVRGKDQSPRVINVRGETICQGSPPGLLGYDM